MTRTGVNLRELQAPIKARYQEQPDAARITLRRQERSLGPGGPAALRGRDPRLYPT